MWVVTNKIKNGNKVDYEVTSDTGEVEQLNKEELIVEIKNNRISNATIQVYKGQNIIRVKGNNVKSTPRAKSSKQKQEQKTILALQLFKNIAKAFGLRTVEEALAIGFDKYELDEEISTKDREKIMELSYQMAVDIKEIADRENNRLLSLYKQAYEKTQNQ